MVVRLKTEKEGNKCEGKRERKDGMIKEGGANKEMGEGSRMEKGRENRKRKRGTKTEERRGRGVREREG